jgi:hypothetical protein
MRMKKRSGIYTILIIVLLFVQQFISGCATTVTNDLHKDDLIREDLRKEELVKEKLHKEEVDLVSQTLFNIKCSLCHELPDVNAYPYTPEQWSSVIDVMHDTKASRKFITVEEEDKIKVYLGRLSQAR